MRLKSMCPQLAQKVICFVGIAIFLLVLDTDAQTQWSSMESDHFRIFFTKDSHTAERLARICEQFYLDIVMRLGPISTEPLIEVWLSESEQHFRSTVDAPIQDWAVACAYPVQRRIVLQRPGVFSAMKLDFDTTVKHELVHVVFGQRVLGVIGTVPHWYSEGVAMFLSEEWGLGYQWRLLGHSLWQRLIPLQSLRSQFPQDTAKAHLAYTESFAALEYLADMDQDGDRTGGPIRGITDLMASGYPFETALFNSTGMDLPRFEEGFGQYVRRRYHWLPILSSTFVFWGGVAIIVILVYYRRRLTQKQMLEEWREKETQVDPFFS